MRYFVGTGVKTKRDQTGYFRIKAITAGIFTWLLLLLMFVPFLTYGIGLISSKFITVKPFQLLHLAFTISLFGVSYLFVLNRKTLLKRVIACFPDATQMVIILIFAGVVILPRLLIVGPQYRLAIYDDFWHYQKIVSIFATFPDFRHYFFPDLRFNYYFYAYLLPAFFYTLKTGLNIKLIWLIYTFTVTLSFTILIVTCFNRFLPKKNGLARLLFVLCVTFIGGLHEWFFLLHDLTIKSSEWWALRLGLPLQVSSFFTINFWVPQHLCGLGFFCLVVYLLRNYYKGKYIIFICGFLVGIQTGFSVFVAIFTCLYVALVLIQKGLKNLTDAAVAGIQFGGALYVTLLPILKFFLDQGNTISIAPDISKFPFFLFFLFVEFGAFLLLFAGYAYDKLIKRQVKNSFEPIDIWFVLISFMLIFFIRSEGYNDFSFRGLIPAQIIIFFIGAIMIGQVNAKLKIMKLLVYSLLFIQVTAFMPELLAMTKICWQKSYRKPKLPPFIQHINASAPFDSVIPITAQDANDTQLFKIELYNIFRMKNVDKSLMRKGKIDKINLVFLNETDKHKLFEAK